MRLPAKTVSLVHLFSYWLTLSLHFPEKGVEITQGVLDAIFESDAAKKYLRRLCQAIGKIIF